MSTKSTAKSTVNIEALRQETKRLVEFKLALLKDVSENQKIFGGGN